MSKEADQPEGQERNKASREEKEERSEEETGRGGAGMNTPSPRRGNTPQGGFCPGNVGFGDVSDLFKQAEAGYTRMMIYLNSFPVL